MGGLLYKPAEKYPGTAVDRKLFRTLPYLLPCLVAMTLTTLNLFANVFFLKETLIKPKKNASVSQDSWAEVDQDREERNDEAAEFTTGSESCNLEVNPLLADAEIVENDTSPESSTNLSSANCRVHEMTSGSLSSGVFLSDDDEDFNSRGEEVFEMRPQNGGYTRLRSSASDSVAATHARCKQAGCCQLVKRYFSAYNVLRNPTIRSAVLSYVLLALIAVVNFEVIPLLLLNDHKHGGLCFNSSEIGMVMGAVGVFQLFIQLLAYPPLAKRLGYRRLFQSMVFLFSCSFAFFPWAASMFGSLDPVVRAYPETLEYQTTHSPATLAPPNINSSFLASSATGADVDSSGWHSNDLNSTIDFGDDSTSHHRLNISTETGRWVYTGRRGNMSNIAPRPGTDTCVVYRTSNQTQIASATSACGRSKTDADNETYSSAGTFSQVGCVPWWVWPTLGVMVSLCVQPLIMAFTSINILVNNSCGMEIRGRVNGISQQLAAVVRFLGPMIAIVFAATTDNNLPFPLNYHLTFLLTSSVGILAVFVNRRLPATIERGDSLTATGLEDDSPLESSSSSSLTVLDESNTEESQL